MEALMSRSERRHLETRDEILREARTLVEAEGAHNLSMRELAKRLEFTSPALYRYFPGGKDEILSALADSSLVLLAEHFGRVPPDLPPGERLLELALVYLEFAREHRRELDLMLQSVAVIQVDGFGGFGRPGPEGVFGMIEQALVDAAKAGVIKASSPGEFVLVFHGAWSLLHGMAVLEGIHPHHEELFRVHARDLVRAFLNGLTTDWLKEKG
jgi:AcrR family transcriptional regulator